MPSDPFPPPSARAGTLGAVLAGGASRRFGAPKALAEVGGRAIVERVAAALGEAADGVVLIANEPSLFAHLHLPTRPDDVAGVGPLGGIRTALAWARERGRRGALCVACDMPFVSPALLREIVSRAEAGDAVVPGSGGRRGCEPLCAWWPVEVLPAIDGMIEAGESAVHRLLDRVPVERVAIEIVARYGDPDVLFLNVNTADDHALALRLASSTEGSTG